MIIPTHQLVLTVNCAQPGCPKEAELGQQYCRHCLRYQRNEPPLRKLRRDKHDPATAAWPEGY